MVKISSKKNFEKLESYFKSKEIYWSDIRGIRTRDLLHISTEPLPLDQGAWWWEIVIFDLLFKMSKKIGTYWKKLPPLKHILALPT